ncbi:MAG: histidine kinase [Bacteroidetes bacterium]|nr:histidine kinase [Bacteroidota bacterium]
MNSSRLNNIAINIYAWLALMLLFFTVLYYFTDFQFAISFIIFIIFPVILPVYIHFCLVDRFFLKKKFFKYSVYTLLLVTISGFLAQYIADVSINTDDFYFGGYLNPLIFILISTGIKGFRDNLRNKIKLTEAEAAKARAESELRYAESRQAFAELEFLKSQVNPHFLFNNLNNIYSLVLENSEYTAEAIMKLSELMRYIIDSGKNNLIGIDKELDFIKNYVSIEELRLKNKCVISLNIQGNSNKLSLPPMLMLPLVENAFKHGIGTDVKKNFIEINITITGKRFELNIHNSIGKKNAGENNGTGIINLEKRLRILYPESYMLEISQNDGNYHSQLKINL